MLTKITRLLGPRQRTLLLTEQQAAWASYLCCFPVPRPSQEELQRGPGGWCALGSAAPPPGNRTHHGLWADMPSCCSGGRRHTTALWAHLLSCPRLVLTVFTCIYTNILRKGVWNIGQLVLLLLTTDMRKQETWRLSPSNTLSSKKLLVIQNTFSYRKKDGGFWVFL